MAFLVYLLSLALIQTCRTEKIPFGKHEEATVYSVAQTNKWVDGMLKKGMEELKKSVGPIVLPTQNIEFDVQVLWEDVKGGFNLTNGKLEHVFDIHRIGDSKLEYENEMVIARVKLGVEDLKGSYGISFKFGHLHDAGTVTVSIETIQLGIEANQFFSPTKGDSNILNLDINLHAKIYLGKIQVSVDMGGSGSIYEKQLESQVEKHVRGFLPSLVKKHMGNIITDVGDIADVAIRAYNDYED